MGVFQQRSIQSLGVCLGLLSMGCQVPEVVETVTRPNVVLIVIDTLRAEALGVYGSPLPTSPELDELAEQGVRFEQVIAQCTWTRPSIGSLLTSLSPRELGLHIGEIGESIVLPDRVTTLAEVFRANGYRTLGATANPVINSHFNFHQGFDKYIDAEVLFEEMELQAGQIHRGRQGRWLPNAREIFEATLAAIEDSSPHPQFVFLNIMDVHEFFVEEIPREGWIGDLFPKVPLDYSRRYMQSVRIASLEVGRFVERIAELQGWEDTVFVITSDHGETLEDHPGVDEPRSHGYLVYDSQAWVPLILYSTTDRLPRGTTVQEPMRLLDLLPTLLDLAGLPVVEGALGRSMMPLIRGSAAVADVVDPIVVETKFRNSNKIAVYSPDWIYVENRDGHGGTNPIELHDRNVRQNGSATDLASRFPGVSESMKAFLKEWEYLNPPQPPTFAGEEPSPELLEKLRALGYVD